MKHLAVRLIVSLLTFAIGLASFGLLGSSRHVSNSKDEQAVLRTEHQYIQAHLDCDIETLDRILASDFTIKGRSESTTKAERLALLARPGVAFEYINTYNVEVEVQGDSATVTGEAFFRSRRYDYTYTSPAYSFTRRYEKRDGDWKIVSVVVNQ